jgi:hypothetical protein
LLTTSAWMVLTFIIFNRALMSQRPTWPLRSFALEKDWFNTLKISLERGIKPSTPSRILRLTPSWMTLIPSTPVSFSWDSSKELIKKNYLITREPLCLDQKRFLMILELLFSLTKE